MLLKFTPNSELEKRGAPNYIKCPPFQVKERLVPFEIIEKVVTKSTQMEWINSMYEGNGGWVAFICGKAEDIRLFAYQLASFYLESTPLVKWHRPSSSRYDEFLDQRKDTFFHMLVLDSLLTHPNLYKKGFEFDPIRIGKIYDLTGSVRGRTSCLVLCPDISPEEAYQISRIQPDFMISLKAGGEKEKNYE